MWFGVSCSSVLAKNREDWGLVDPSSDAIDDFQKTCDIIYKKVIEFAKKAED